MEAAMKIVKSDGSVKTVDKKTVKDVGDYLDTTTPSFYKRDFFQMMFD